MDVNDILKVVNGYNAHAEEVIDKLTDKIICQTIDALNKIYKDGNWLKMLYVDYFAVKIEVFDCYVGDIVVETEIAWHLYEETPKEAGMDYFIHFDEEQLFSNEEALKEYCVGSFEGEELKKLLPLVKNLEKKGFECYYDTENYHFLAFVKVK